MNPRKRVLTVMVAVPIIFMILIGMTFVRNYFNSNYNDIISSVYINNGQSLLVAVKNSDSTVKKIKFFEIDSSTDEIINSFSIETNTVNNLNLKYDDNNALITVINDDGDNSALSVYNIYKYESGKEPELISSDMQSDTSFKNLFDWRDGLAIFDEDVNGDEAAVYIKDGEVKKQLISSNEDIKNNIKRYANEAVVGKTDEIPYAELNLYDGRSAFIGMFLNADGEFPISIGDKDTALSKLADILYSDTKLIKLFASDSGYRTGIYSYGKESAKTLLKPDTVIYNADVFYPDMDNTIVVGTTQAAVNSEFVGYVYDNKTGEISKDISQTLNKATGLDITSLSNVYISGNALCLISDGDYYSIGLETGNVNTVLNSELIHVINQYDKYTLSSLYDYALSDDGSILLYNLVMWIMFPMILLIFSLVARYQKNSLAKRSKLISATITGINPMPMRMYGINIAELEVEAYISGALKKFKIRSPIPKGQQPMVGQSIVILYDQKTGRASIADDKMVNAALGKPVVEEAVIESIEDLNVNVADTDLLKLNVALLKDKNQKIKVPAVQTNLFPFKVGETISIRYMSNSMNDTAMVVGRGKNISSARTNYNGKAEIISARSVGPAIDGRYIMDVDTVCRARAGNVTFQSIILTKDTSVLQPGVQILFTADKELFEKRLRLQNKQQDTAIVSKVEATGDSVGYSPVLKITLKIVSGDGQYVELTAIENISPFNIPKEEDKVLIGYDIDTKEATIIKKL